MQYSITNKNTIYNTSNSKYNPDSFLEDHQVLKLAEHNKNQMLRTLVKKVRKLNTRQFAIPTNSRRNIPMEYPKENYTSPYIIHQIRSREYIMNMKKEFMVREYQKYYQYEAKRKNTIPQKPHYHKIDEQMSLPKYTTSIQFGTVNLKSTILSSCDSTDCSDSENSTKTLHEKRNIIERLACYKKLAKEYINETEYEAFLKKFNETEKYMLSYIKNSNNELKTKTGDSIFFSLAVLIGSKHGLSKKGFHKIMLQERGKKSRVKLERIKTSKCYQLLKIG